MNSFISACKEFAQASLFEHDDFNSKEPTPELASVIIHRLNNMCKGIGLREGWVPSTTFWLIDNEEYIGCGNIRHALTDQLRKFGGHIGYDIRPSKWRQGYGTMQLRLLLAEAAKLGIQNALITCSAENKASAKVIEKNGGIFKDCIVNINDGKERLTLRYTADTGLKDGVLYTTGKPWFHGSNVLFDTLREGSTITQWEALAEAFSHQPTMLGIGDDMSIEHNGTQPGFLYMIDEPLIPGEDIYMHPRTSMEPGLEWLTVKPLKVRQIKGLPNL